MTGPSDFTKGLKMTPWDMSEDINGVRYFTVKHFALATNRSEPNVRFLMAYGNRIRKIKVVYMMNKPMIPYSELTEFPFTLAGRNSSGVYHYTEEGTMTEVGYDV